jgi:hypothetical protein
VGDQNTGFAGLMQKSRLRARPASFAPKKRTFAELKPTLELGVQDDAAAFVMVLKEKKRA